jgi:hypothetical protein
MTPSTCRGLCRGRRDDDDDVGCGGGEGGDVAAWWVGADTHGRSGGSYDDNEEEVNVNDPDGHDDPGGRDDPDDLHGGDDGAATTTTTIARARFRARVAYRGTTFRGFQLQRGGSSSLSSSSSLSTTARTTTQPRPRMTVRMTTPCCRHRGRGVRMDDNMDDDQDDDNALPVPGRRRGGRCSASIGDDKGDADADDNDDNQADNDDDNQLMGTVRGGGDTREGQFWGVQRGRIVICWSFFASQKNNSNYNFRHLPSNQNTTIYSACALGVRRRYPHHDQHVFRAQLEG